MITAFLIIFVTGLQYGMVYGATIGLFFASKDDKKPDVSLPHGSIDMTLKRGDTS